MIDLGQLLESSGAILHGHFLLTSGRHSDVYFEKFRVLEQPEVLTALCAQIASHFSKPTSPFPSPEPPRTPRMHPHGYSVALPLSEGEKPTPPIASSTDLSGVSVPPTSPSAAHTSAQGAGARIDLVAGPTTGGIIIAFEVARQMGLPALYVETENGQKKLRRGAQIPEGARVLIVDDVLTTGTSIREVIEVIREAGGEPAGVGVLIDRAETPPDFGVPLFASYKVEAQTFAPDDVPDWLAALPITKPGTRASV